MNRLGQRGLKRLKGLTSFRAAPAIGASRDFNKALHE
jgi:hypothetical protein